MWYLCCVSCGCGVAEHERGRRFGCLGGLCLHPAEPASWEEGEQQHPAEWKPPGWGHGASLLRDWEKGSLSMQLEEQCEWAVLWRELWFLLLLAPKVSLTWGLKIHIGQENVILSRNLLNLYFPWDIEEGSEVLGRNVRYFDQQMKYNLFVDFCFISCFWDY